MNVIRIVPAVALLVTGAAATAQTATSDARCILLSSAYARQETNADAQKLAEATLYFYLGRVGASTNATQLKAIFDAQGKSITDATAGGLMDGCVKEFQSRVNLLKSLAPPAPPPATKK
jgi:hypothetical protein